MWSISVWWVYLLLFVVVFIDVFADDITLFFRRATCDHVWADLKRVRLLTPVARSDGTRGFTARTRFSTMCIHCSKVKRIEVDSDD